MELYRHDGVLITHDPFAPGMAEKYGRPGMTDNEGFDPYADSVGAGIYGGIVKRDTKGRVVIGQQYQNHNPKPGPVYAGGGYTPITAALKDAQELGALLKRFPDLVNDVSTGGAQPLHNCGMSPLNQRQTAVLIEHGADIEAVDTYGFTPLMRMASNNLAVGAQMLLDAGADPENKGGSRDAPINVAAAGRAADVLKVLQGAKRKKARISRIVVAGAAEPSVNGDYRETSADEIPPGFAAVCKTSGWDVNSTWQQLNQGSTWFKGPAAAYIYFNVADGCWWIDAPDGGGIYKARAPAHAPPAQGWTPLNPRYDPPPSHVAIFRQL